MARKVTRGTGITTREMNVEDLECADDARRFSRSWNQSIKEGGGIFGVVSLGAAQTCERILARATDADPMEDSPAAFARAIANGIRAARARIQNGNADLAARHAWDAGVAWATATMKCQWEEHALRGEKVATAASDGADKTNSRHRAQRERRMARMTELVPELGVDSAASHCEVEGLGTRGAIKRQWYRHTKIV